MEMKIGKPQGALFAHQLLFERSNTGTINVLITQEEINQRRKDQEEGGIWDTIRNHKEAAWPPLLFLFLNFTAS